MAEQHVLAWRVRIRGDLRPRRRRCPRSDLAAKHLLTAYTACGLVNLGKPGFNDFHREVHVPDTDQVLVKTFVPHKAVGVVGPVWDNREQCFILLLLNDTVLKNHLIAIHVSHATKHVA